jgi:hypothetical protein
MDNQVHHPHVTYSSEVGGAYSKDYYNDKARNCDDCSEDLGCGCLGLFFMCVAMLSTALFFVKFVGTPNNSFTNFCLQSVSCNDAKEAERRAAEEKRKADSIKYVQDSIVKYNQIHDSIAVAIKTQDSLDAELVKKQQVKAEYIAIIDDGVTSREVKVNAVADSLTPEGMQAMGESFTEMSLNAVRDRQNEIDNNKVNFSQLKIQSDLIIRASI